MTNSQIDTATHALTLLATLSALIGSLKKLRRRQPHHNHSTREAKYAYREPKASARSLLTSRPFVLSVWFAVYVFALIFDLYRASGPITRWNVLNISIDVSGLVFGVSLLMFYEILDFLRDLP